MKVNLTYVIDLEEMPQRIVERLENLKLDVVRIEALKEIIKGDKKNVIKNRKNKSNR